MSDGLCEFIEFWTEILEEEKSKGNIKRVEEIQKMIDKHKKEDF